MSDLISRADLFDELNRRGVPYNADVNMVINGMPSAQPEQQWIPCSERLPEKDGMYFVTDRNIFGIDVCILSFGEPHLPMNSAPKNKRNWYMSDRDGDFYWDDVIAWMPLPEPWKGEQQ